MRKDVYVLHSLIFCLEKHTPIKIYTDRYVLISITISNLISFDKTSLPMYIAKLLWKPVVSVTTILQYVNPNTKAR